MHISMHIPKTGGNTFKTCLDAVFDGRVCYRYGSPPKFVDMYPPTALQRGLRAVRYVKSRVKSSGRLRDDHRCVHGHFRADAWLQRFPQAEFITWVRNPVERVVSQYHFWQRHPYYDHTVCAYLMRYKLSLAEFAALSPMRNLQSKYFNSLPPARFDFIGITEHFQECIEYFCAQFGAPAPAALPRNVNPMKADGGSYALDREVRTHIENLNSEDMALYAACLERSINLKVIGNSYLRLH